MSASLLCAKIRDDVIQRISKPTVQYRTVAVILLYGFLLLFTIILFSETQIVRNF